jgi:acetyl-CoA carboxylase carboxyl transferase subunit alpha
VAHLDFERPLAELERSIGELRTLSDAGAPDVALRIRELEERASSLRDQLYGNLTTWQKVQLSRHPDRPYFMDYLELLFDDLLELHGDRVFADDPAIVAGFARLDGRTVAVIGQQKGRSTKEKVLRNFGMPHPEGYRKAMRVMELAARFKRPVLTFIDTPGAYPGIGAEERGQSEAIGQSILVMSQLPVPTIATVIGEGGSGGALALGVADRVMMMDFATYSVITPEGCASILWHDGSRAPDAADQLKLTSADAFRLGIVDELIPEPGGGAHRDRDAAARSLGGALRRQLASVCALEPKARIDARYAKFRAMGRFTEPR